jgi:hypothetical protein
MINKAEINTEKLIEPEVIAHDKVTNDRLLHQRVGRELVIRLA